MFDWVGEYAVNNKYDFGRIKFGGYFTVILSELAKYRTGYGGTQMFYDERLNRLAIIRNDLLILIDHFEHPYQIGIATEA